MSESAFESSRHGVGLRALHDLRRPRVLHPFMLAVCPALALYGQNAATIPFARVYPSVAIFVVGTFVVWIALARACRDIHRAGAAASALLLSGFLAWPILESSIEILVPLRGVLLIGAIVLATILGAAAIWFVIARGGLGRVGVLVAVLATVTLALGASPAFGRRAAFAIALYVSATGIVAGVLLRFQGDRFRLTSSTNVFGVALLALYAGYALLQERARATLPPWPPESLIESVSSQGGGRATPAPDIYVIALDGYPREDVLRDGFGFDNSAFLNGLSQRGFTIAGGVQAAQFEPVQALAACFNLAPVDAWLPESLSEGARSHYIQRALERNVLLPALRERGYGTLAFDSGIEALRPRHSFELTLKPMTLVGEFEQILFDRTIVARGLQWYFWARYRNPTYWRFEPTRRYVEYVFDVLPAVQGEMPKFVFAYVPTPEPPFLFRSDGSRAYPYAVGPLDTARLFYDSELQRRAFLDQLEYLNTRILKTVMEIQTNAAQAPVIVVMSLRGAALRGVGDGAPPRAEVFAAVAGMDPPTGPVSLVEWFNAIVGASALESD